MSGAVASLSHARIPVAGLRLLDDDRLARRAAEGDTQAFAALYQRHYQALYRYCLAILGNPEDAADALQNTMTSALRALPGERREIRLKPWLYRVAHNESISLLRKRPPHAELEEAINVAAPRGPDVATRERLRELVADLRGLQDRQRAALVMRELSGLGYDEIGLALGSSPAATKQLVYEARTALHEMADGRAMSCDSVRRSLSAEDRRKLRGRKLRAHLKACAGCREFQTMIDVRQRDLAALTPPIPPIAAAALLHGLGSCGHGGAAGGLGSLAGGVTGKAVATSAVAKGLTTVAVIATVSAGTAGLSGHLPGRQGHKEPRAGAAGTSRVSGPVAPRPGAIPPRVSQSHRPVSGEAQRATRPHPPAHSRGSMRHPPSAARTPQFSRRQARPQRSTSRRSAHPQAGNGQSGAVPGRRDKVSPPKPIVTPPIEPASPPTGAADIPGRP
jgi:RNA polymerase sigma factor (sigma-70 family)